MRWTLPRGGTRGKGGIEGKDSARPFLRSVATFPPLPTLIGSPSFLRIFLSDTFLILKYLKILLPHIPKSNFADWFLSEIYILLVKTENDSLYLSLFTSDRESHWRCRNLLNLFLCKKMRNVMQLCAWQMNDDDGNDGRERGMVLGTGAPRGWWLYHGRRAEREREPRDNWDITPCSSAVSCSSPRVARGSAVFDAGYHVDRHSERGGTECTKGRQLQIVDIYANTNDCMSAAR